MQQRRWIRRLLAVAVGTMPVVAAQFTSPNVITTPGAVARNARRHGVRQSWARRRRAHLRLAAGPVRRELRLGVRPADHELDEESGGSYDGTLNILPDRGYNNGNYFADYAARIQKVNFAFTPYTGSANIGGTTIAEDRGAEPDRLHAPRSPARDSPISIRFAARLSFTTGLDPGVGFTTLFGQTCRTSSTTRARRRRVDLRHDVRRTSTSCRSTPKRWCSRPTDRATSATSTARNIYYFNSSKQIVGVIVPAASACVPHLPPATPFFGGAPNPIDGRRPNQGIEGVALSPDGTRLFALLQSATMQDSDSAQPDAPQDAPAGLRRQQRSDADQRRSSSTR